MTDYTRKVDIVKDSANVANRKKIVYVDASSSTTVTAGSLETITIQPPQGKIWKVIQFYFKVSAPAGATSGNQYAGITNNQFSLFEQPYASTTYSGTIEIRHYPHEYNLLKPSISVEEFGHFIERLKGSYDYPLAVKYQNATDVNQTNTRIIKLILEEEDEAE